MAIKTTLEQLEEVQAAITSLAAGGQSYMLGDIRVTKASLATLERRERYLKARYNRERGRSPGRVRLNLSGGV